MSYILFAQWFGVISTILALGMLFNLGDARRMAKHMVEEESGYVMGGVLPIIFGSLALMHHHEFSLGWELVVSLIGVFMMLIGIFRVWFVHAWKKMMYRFLDQVPTLFSLFGLMFGLLLLYVGFVAPIVNVPQTLL